MTVSRFETGHANVYTRESEFYREDVIRRIGGEESSGETVSAIVQLDSRAANLAADRGGLIDSADGQVIEHGGLLELYADQAANHMDKWVIRGVVYVQIGRPTEEDAASKTIVFARRLPQRGRRSRLVG